ncbi:MULTISPECIES: replication initiation protein [unclassified Campylobacter]|uniref:replication initiation protein n=1 Tax=unclassified Campylobacter TaxID=2593542 RepID=UPI0012381CF7|nr:MULTISPECIES: replication initiation protein [unclassified Campylobacter]KAA6224965.1 replication initiation protein [Campylobacter sp. LR196d]KAA6225287.1 replication initiation protein [Campylobacter sp. LR286c]KAA6225594.1 replication initiation protein [Campylobacter sp. LR185c]KAA6230412.1 replication initiation protein [Campylobacter sp. LR291e]KAA6230563.1 replication initiation protein [Campylobacter sp. LR264d]
MLNFQRIVLKKIIKTQKGYTLKTFNLFDSFVISNKLKNIEIKANENLSILIKDLKTIFTSKQLREFLSLKDTYAKILYMILKNCKDSGVCNSFKIKWQDFKEIFAVPQNYTKKELSKFVLKLAIDELSSPRHIFNQNIIFRNLSFEKVIIVRKIVGIKFLWTPTHN